jgi:hypothetical protein
MSALTTAAGVAGQSSVYDFLLALLNVVQTVALAYLAARSHQDRPAPPTKPPTSSSSSV